MVVVGSGAAGISVALTAAAAGLRVLVVTKDLVGGATPLAQGGLAAALGPGDAPAAHAADTMVAGAGLCEPGVVSALAEGAPGAIAWLTGLGAQLETRDLRLEGGHSARRIVHSGDDATGAEVHRTLLAALVASGIEILDRTVALDLVLSGVGARRFGAGQGEGRAGVSAQPRVTGGTAAANARPVDAFAGELVPAPPWHADRQAVTGLLAGAIGADGWLAPGLITARAVVIAAGGLGQAFGTTSNPAGATGDGIAVAARAGAVIRDLEFVQFHPTVLWLPGASGQCPLITEALRGAGAVLRDLDGTPLMAGHDPRGDLAPRDVVAARVAEAIAAASAGHVWLDATALGRHLLEDGFPTVTAACRKHGIDPVTDLIPVAPGAHYSCGGILADLDGRTTVPGLYAAGEAASTGVQGANRLASNSVTEAIIAGRRTGAAVAALAVAEGIAVRSPSPADASHHPERSRVSPEAGSGTYLVPVTAPFGRDRGSKRGTAPGTGTELPFRPTLPPPFPGRFDDRGSSAAHGAADDPRSGLGPSGRRVGQPSAASPQGTPTGPRTRTRRLALAQDMSRYAGVLRDGDRLTKLVRVISADGASVTGPRPAAPAGTATGHEQAGTVMRILGVDLDLEAVEAANLRVVSLLIAAGARRRAESRGCHRRGDAAGTAAAPWHTLARWDGRELTLTEEAATGGEWTSARNESTGIVKGEPCPQMLPKPSP